MISRIEGILETIEQGHAEIRVEGGLTYEVALTAWTAGRLGGRLGESVQLQTVHYMEGSAQGNHFVPRLTGFLNASDRDFFELFTTVKGIGPRKAVRCLALDTALIAAAIADRDVKMLQSLPEIGKRMAETIVATLHGKVDRFVAATTYTQSPASSRASDASTAPPAASRSLARETLEILLQLGENRAAAVAWIDQAMMKNPDIDSSEQLLSEVFRLKGGL